MADISAPKPEVQHLPTIFRSIRAGEVQIPRFQRGFVWQEKQILELLESVYKGYPIGSILLWRPGPNEVEIRRDDILPFPDIDDKMPAIYVLDGMQRLATLFGVLNYDASRMPAKFCVGFDLERQIFLPCDPMPDGPVVMMGDLFTPRKLMETQSKLAAAPNGDELIERTLRLYSSFQEYLVPLVTIERRPLSDVVPMFERVNSTGQRLVAVDFLRALTWSEAFDLNEQLEELKDNLPERFDIDEETLVKMLALIKERDPLPDQILRLREFDAAELRAGVRTLNDALGRMCSFLQQELKIHSLDYVPYEGQLLALGLIFARIARLDDEQKAALVRWIWAVEFSEAMKGRPDHLVVRMVKNVARVIAERQGPLNVRLILEKREFGERVFQARAALSCGIATMFANNEPRSVLTGGAIEPAFFMREFAKEHFASVVPIEAVRQMRGEHTRSARLITNVIVVSEEDVARMEQENALGAVLAVDRIPNQEEVLQSQFLSGEMLVCLRGGEYERFLELRTERIMERIVELVSDPGASFGNAQVSAVTGGDEGAPSA
jgi:Protein of unknown function DUF262